MAGIKKAAKRAGRGVINAAKPVVKAAVRAAVAEVRRQQGPQIAAMRSLIRGKGDYTVGNSNRLMMPRQAANAAFGSTSIRLRRREMIKTIISSSTIGAFQIEKFVMNAGLPATFPWLAVIANVFESWRPMGMAFEFVSTSGTAVGSTNTALGQVIMAPQYNAYGLDPINKIQLEGFPDAVANAVDVSSICGVECVKGLRQSDALLIRNTNVVSQSSSMSSGLFDLGDFFIATQGCQGASVTVGDLWVTYDVELFNPIVPRSLVPGSLQAQSNSVNNQVSFFDTTTVDSDPQGIFDTCSGDTFYLKNLRAGDSYLVVLYYTQTSAVGSMSVGSSGCCLMSEIHDAPADGITATSRMFQIQMNIINNGGTGSFTLTLATTSYSSYRMGIYPIAADVAIL